MKAYAVIKKAVARIAVNQKYLFHLAPCSNIFKQLSLTNLSDIVKSILIPQSKQSFVHASLT